uniref:Uncharacterized protein n=1 Tax=Romanomermis culicivorax TaxID=13658 RepID=A0A915J9V6_ROMCU
MSSDEIKNRRNFRRKTLGIKPNLEAQSTIVGDENPRTFSLLNQAFCKLPIHSVESPTVADKNSRIFNF